MPAPGNLVVNPSFEAGMDAWKLNPSSAGITSSPSGGAPHCDQTLQVQIVDAGEKTQLFQTDIAIQAGQSYHFSFLAKSSSGHDISVHLHDHTSPGIKLGIEGVTFDLTGDWQQFTYNFTAPASSNNARLRFWFAPHDANGDVYAFDHVIIAPNP